MNKIIFCDKNKDLLKEVKKLFNSKDLINNTHCKLIVSDKDVLETKKKYKEAKIITASNQDFTMGGGLDALLKKEYPKQCNNAREFKFEKDLFFTITVGCTLKATKYWMMRAMFGVYMCSRKNDVILTGLETGIGGLTNKDFIYYLKRLINSDFSYSDFRNSDFRNSDFSYSDFRNSDFNYSDFSYSDFRNSDFRNSDFRNSDFRDSDFRNSDFRDSDFNYSDFRDSDFRDSDFRNSDFRDSDFNYSDFRNSDFRNSDFRDSDFNYSDFSYSDFSYSDFSGSIFNFKCYPETGTFIGWKKADDKIIKLEIQDAKNVCGGFVGRKLRTKKVKVIEIQNKKGEKLNIKKINSDYNEKFIYKVGKIIEEKEYVHDNKLECEKGIHFFITREEAVNY